MTSFNTAVALAAILALGVATAHAQGVPRPGELGKRGGFMVQSDLDFGGDDIATVEFEDGDTQDVKSGQGIVVSLGGYFRPIETSSFELQGLLGYKFVTTAATNADIKVTRLVTQLLGVYRFDNGMYLGGGLVRHSNVELDGDGFFEDMEFDDATGVNLEIGWRWIALHYTRMDYAVEGGFFDGIEVDASNIGLRFSYRF